MRIFIGIKFDKSTHEGIESALKNFKEIGAPIKWVKTENIHLTLKFIGEITQDEYSQIEKVLMKSDFNVGAFDIEVAGFGKFGRGRELNVLWVGIEEKEQLKNLYLRIEEALEEIGINKENRPFKPHATVGRSKKSYNFKPIFELLEQNADIPIRKLRVTSFQIFKSELYATGPVYTILKEIAVDNT
jgi:2'-5' RNA ligase